MLAKLYPAPDSRRAIRDIFRDINDRVHAFRGYVNTQEERPGHEHFAGLPDVGRKLRWAVEAAEDRINDLQPPSGSVDLRSRNREVLTVLIIEPSITDSDTRDAMAGEGPLNV